MYDAFIELPGSDPDMQDSSGKAVCKIFKG